MVLSDVSSSFPPSVFISSTVREFRDLRSAIAYTLRAQGLNVYLSEAADFDIRGDRSAFEECFANIRTSDYYILLIGNTRGNLYEEGISITRQEYRFAKSQFLSSGRPRLFFYLREATEVALRGTQEVQLQMGIDDPSHLASFINEVEQPGIEGAPNFLARFRDFEDLIHSVISHLNLGRTLAETLNRHSLASELLLNISSMVDRTGTTAFPRHWYMSRLRQEVSITPEKLHNPITLSDDHVISLGFALVGRTRGKDLRTKAIEESLDRGVFLTFNVVSGTLEESPLHQLLRQTLEDVKRLSLLDATIADPDWDSKILIYLRERRPGRPRSIELMGYDLVTVLGHYDRVENVFSGHLALLRVLLGLNEQLPSYKRQPETPLGDEMDQAIRAERVSASELTLLIQNDIWPFGSRAPRDLWGETHEEQVQKVTGMMRNILTNVGIEADPRFLATLRNAAESFLQEHTATPEEGIEDLRSK